MTDPWLEGFRRAGALTFEQQLIVLRLDAVTWSPEYLDGFLLEMERTGRVQACTCLRCPIHTTSDHIPQPHES